jgi:hypothetical protein
MENLCMARSAAPNAADLKWLDRIRADPRTARVLEEAILKRALELKALQAKPKLVTAAEIGTVVLNAGEEIGVPVELSFSLKNKVKTDLDLAGRLIAIILDKAFKDREVQVRVMQWNEGCVLQFRRRKEGGSPIKIPPAAQPLVRLLNAQLEADPMLPDVLTLRLP